jgi:chromosome partitioning protein
VKVWAVANQKGGVGKTTTSVSLGGLLAARGHDTLLVDMDPHGSLTSYFGLDPDTIEHSVYQLFQPQPGAEAEALLVPTREQHLWLLPAASVLATLERQLGARGGMGLVLKQQLTAWSGRFAHALIDCPPMLGVLMVNALAACEHLIVPVQTEFLALHGLERMLQTLDMVTRTLRRTLPCTIVPTLYDRRTRAALESLAALKERYGERLWSATIPVDTQFREASHAGASPARWCPQSRGVLAYQALLDTLLTNAAPATAEAVAT